MKFPDRIRPKAPIDIYYYTDIKYYDVEEQKEAAEQYYRQKDIRFLIDDFLNGFEMYFRMGPIEIKLFLRMIATGFEGLKTSVRFTFIARCADYLSKRLTKLDACRNLQISYIQDTLKYIDSFKHGCQYYGMEFKDNKFIVNQDYGNKTYGGKVVTLKEEKLIKEGAKLAKVEFATRNMKYTPKINSAITKGFKEAIAVFGEEDANLIGRNLQKDVSAEPNLCYT